MGAAAGRLISKGGSLIDVEKSLLEKWTGERKELIEFMERMTVIDRRLCTGENSYCRAQRARAPENGAAV